MSSNKLNIPTKIKVGFQKRDGTYTGKLAFITYFGPKGDLRKERSWDGWRDSKIDPEEFDNEPTDGFVLNKKVGDYRSRYGGRSAWIRIYDPRGFEFEISVQNLLFLLEECNCIKGKGLEGEFIYAWDGQNLVLLPVGSIEHKESTEYTALQTKKVTRKDMIEGCLYKSKNAETFMYLGRHPWYAPGSRNYDDGYGYTLKENKVHVYWDIEDKLYLWNKGFTWLAERLDDVPSADFADRYSDFKDSKYSNSFSRFVIEKNDGSKINGGFIKKADDYFKIRVYEPWNRSGGKRLSIADLPVKINGEMIHVPRPRWSYYGSHHGESVSKEQLQSMKVYDIFIEAKNGDRTPV